MPWTESNGYRLAYDESGRPDAPVLLMCHSLGTSADLWRPQVEALGRHFRVLTPDMRGHGRSEVPPGEYTIAQLGGDALAVLDAAGASRAHVCGLSIGGVIGMWLAVHAPERVERLVAACTAARISQPEVWTERIAVVRTSGLDGVSEASMARWFTAPYRERHPDVVSRYRALSASTNHDGYVGCCAVLRDTDLSNDLPRVTAPTLVISGTFDPVAPPANGQAICDRIPGARMITLEGGHLPNVEKADEFNGAVTAFLQ